MTDLFGRAWRIQIDDVVIEGDMTRPSVPIEFDVTRDRGKAPNTALVVVKNLSEQTRGALQSVGDAVAQDPTGGIFCSINAGYIDDAISEIFRGDLRHVRNYRTGPDWFTEVTSGDGEQARKARTARSYPRNTGIADVARDVAADLGVGVGNIADAVAAAELAGIPGVSQFYTGYVSSGSAQYELSRLLRPLGLEWSVQSGVLQVTLEGEPLGNVPSVKLTPSSGLLDSPQPGGKRGVVKARAKIIPGLVPGWPVEVQSRYVSGVYRIERASYQGQSHGSQWSVDLELKEIP